ncbi:magnesium/cobalt transporter CorA [Desulfocurvibacter africanus]|uniref:magnesium/cobalt transporter CorA n=1 Tax=Desulfocurvibacter africanus TaxID=873 RepID=UPI002FD9DC97
MVEESKDRESTVGLPPGTMRYIGPQKTFRPRAELVHYSEGKATVLDATDVCPPLPAGGVIWMRVRGLHDEGLVKRVGEAFSLSPMLLEDVLNTGQRSKIEEHEDCLFIVLKSLSYEPGPTGKGEVREEQVSLVLGDNYVLSFSEGENGLFEPILQRLVKGRSRAHRLEADYLFLMLVDTAIDHTFLALTRLGDEIEDMEEQLIEESLRADLAGIYRLRRAVLAMSRSLWPLREVVSILRKPDPTFIREENLVFVRDIYDQGMQAVETLEAFRQALTDMIEITMSSVTMRTNEVMKVLTTVATIFIPLTFITGLYGMNFRHMPELGWRYGYYAALALMALVAGGMILYFKRKDWF